VRIRWPLLGPFVAFAVWTLVAALASDRPRERCCPRGGSSRSARSTSCCTRSERPRRRGASAGLFSRSAGGGRVDRPGLVSAGGGQVESGGVLVRAGLQKVPLARAASSIYMTLPGCSHRAGERAAAPGAGGRALLWALPAGWPPLALGLSSVRGGGRLAVGGVGARWRSAGAGSRWRPWCWWWPAPSRWSAHAEAVCAAWATSTTTTGGTAGGGGGPGAWGARIFLALFPGGGKGTGGAWPLAGTGTDFNGIGPPVRSRTS